MARKSNVRIWIVLAVLGAVVTGVGIQLYLSRAPAEQLAFTRGKIVGKFQQREMALRGTGKNDRRRMEYFVTVSFDLGPKVQTSTIEVGTSEYSRIPEGLEVAVIYNIDRPDEAHIGPRVEQVAQGSLTMAEYTERGDQFMRVLIGVGVLMTAIGFAFGYRAGWQVTT